MPQSVAMSKLINWTCERKTEGENDTETETETEHSWLQLLANWPACPSLALSLLASV